MKTLPDTEKTERATALVAAPVIARQISVTPRYIHQLAAAGKIPCVRIGQKCVRFDRHAVAAALGFEWKGGQA